MTDLQHHIAGRHGADHRGGCDCEPGGVLGVGVSGGGGLGEVVELVGRIRQILELGGGWRNKSNNLLYYYFFKNISIESLHENLISAKL